MVQEGVERGGYRGLTAEEERSWPGTVHYTMFTEVYKTAPDATNPIRACSNSSISYRGCSLNEFLIKGPITVTNILAVTLGF